IGSAAAGLECDAQIGFEGVGRAGSYKSVIAGPEGGGWSELEVETRLDDQRGIIHRATIDRLRTATGDIAQCSGGRTASDFLAPSEGARGADFRLAYREGRVTT